MCIVSIPFPNLFKVVPAQKYVVLKWKLLFF